MLASLVFLSIFLASPGTAAVEVSKLETFIDHELANGGGAFILQGAALPALKKTKQAGVPIAQNRGKVIFIAMLHTNKEAIDASLPELNQAYAGSIAAHRPFRILMDNGSFSLESLARSNRQSVDTVMKLLERALNGDNQARFFFKSFFDRVEPIVRDNYALTGQGTLSQYIDGSCLGVAAWAAQRHVPILLEDIQFDDWLLKLKGAARVTNGLQLVQAGIQTNPNRRQYFDWLDQSMQAFAESTRLRNKHIVQEAANLAKSGTDVALLIGAAHQDIVDLLKAANIDVSQTQANALISEKLLRGNMLVMHGWVTGKPLDRPQREKLYMEDLVAKGLQVYLMSRNIPLTPDADVQILELAGRWKQSDIDSLVVAGADPSNSFLAVAGVVDQWLKRQALTPEQKRLLRPTLSAK